MTLFTGFAVYFLVWWLTLFAVLPIGAPNQAEEGPLEPGTDPGAPKHSRLGFTLLLNTVVASVVFGAFWVAGAVFGLGLDSLPNPFADDR